MTGSVEKHRFKNEKKESLCFSVLTFFIICTILSLSVASSAKPSGEIVYVATDGKGDFNCDGSDDQVEINEALAYVAKKQQYTTVYLKGPDTYVISDSILIGSNTTFEGDSTAVVELTDKAGWKKEKPLITQMDSVGNQNIIIKGFEIDGNHGKNNDRNRGKGYYNLVYFSNSENIQVHDMYMHDSHGDGLKATRCTNIQFYNNSVYKLGHDALYIIYSSNVEAWNNNITCRTNSGLRIYNTNHVSFQNNIIDSEGEGGAGIEIQKVGSETVMDDIEIFNNLLYETNACGIWITGYGSEYSKNSAKNVFIHHNKFYKTGIDPSFNWVGGIVINGFQDTLIENNLFDGCYGAAVAHKEISNQFSAPGSGYTTVVKNNMIINTQSSPGAGKGYAIYNKLRKTHSFILENNCLSNNAGRDYLFANSTSDVNIDPEFIEQVSKNESMRKNFPWIEALSAGPHRPYQRGESGSQIGQDNFISNLARAFSNLLRFLKRFFLNLLIISDN